MPRPPKRPSTSPPPGADAPELDVGDVALANAAALVRGDAADGFLVSREQVAAEVAEAERARERAYAPRTLEAYRKDWAHFVAYCQDRGAQWLPADALVARTYIAVCAKTLKVATLHRRIAAIAYHHRQAGHRLDTNDAAFRETWRGIRRARGVAQNKKAAAVTAEIKAMLAHLPGDGLATLRDRALLLVGFAGGFRRSELVGLDVGDLRFEPAGVRILVRQSKTDQEGAGLTKEIPYTEHPETCPVRALHDWLEAAELNDRGAHAPVVEADAYTGELRERWPVFRPFSKSGRVLPRRLSDKWVVLLVKRTAAATFRETIARDYDKLSPRAQARHARGPWIEERVAQAVERYAGHSLRAGFITAAAANGVPIHKIMEQTGHVRHETVAGYIRNARNITESAAARLGL